MILVALHSVIRFPAVPGLPDAFRIRWPIAGVGDLTVFADIPAAFVLRETLARRGPSTNLEELRYAT